MKNFSKKNRMTSGNLKNWPKQITAYTDGAARGNPGSASLGLSVENKEGCPIYEEAQAIGVSTNNVAEYKGVYRVLELAVQNKVQELCLKTDSQLVVKQLQGLYKIKAPHLKPLYQKCLNLIDQIDHFSVVHVKREQNKRADELANLALDS